MVFIAWQIPALAVQMMGHFTGSIYVNRTLPLILSTFSQQTPGHILFNMIAMYGVATNLHNMLGREQFLTIYLSGALLGTYASHLVRLAQKNPAHSLGASGAVFALFTASAALNPDAKMAFIFLPFVNFSAGSLIPCVVAFEVIGLTGIWNRLFLIRWDHAGHLGGGLMGFIYVTYFLPQVKKRIQQLRRTR